MSQAKHKSFRKVLSIETFQTEVLGQQVKATRVLWCTVDSFTSSTVKTTHVGFTTYIGSSKFKGTSARLPRKPFSVNLKNPLASKWFADVNIDRVWKESGSEACREYIMGTQSKSLKGTVSWFNTSKGQGYIEYKGELFVVFACNIVGAKTAYPETACMSLTEGSEVTFDLFDFGTHLSAVKVQGGTFDAAKWASLDQSKLAFKTDSEGKFLNGLFS